MAIPMKSRTNKIEGKWKGGNVWDGRGEISFLLRNNYFEVSQTNTRQVFRGCAAAFLPRINSKVSKETLCFRQLVPTTLLYPRIFFSRFDDPPFSLSALFISLSLSLSGTGVPLEETGKPTILRGNKRQETSVYASDFCHDNSTESDVSTVYRNIDLPHFLFSSIELSPRRFE